MRVSHDQPDVCPTILTSNEFRQASSPAAALAMGDSGQSKVQLVQCRLSCTGGNRKRDVIGGSLMNLSSQPSYQSCIYRELPLRSITSVVFLDKSLSISLMGQEGRTAGQPTFYRSTLSIRLRVASSCRSYTDNKPAKTKEAYGRHRATTLGRKIHDWQESGLGHCRGLLSKQQGCEVDQIAPARGINNKADDLDSAHYGSTSALLSLRGPDPLNTKAGRQKENADEAAFSLEGNFRHRQHFFSIGPVDSRIWSKKTVTDNNTQEQQEYGTKPQKVNTLDKASYHYCQVKLDSGEDTSNTLSLKEALELFKPDFISRSQGRVRRLERRARRRRALQDSNPDWVQGLGEERSKRKGNCTTPDPLSDNLFKPRERSISGREMQLRSRRIYNKLPEVTKKKEEEKRRAVSQTNRLRVEVFKKRLLDQILQR